jgi:ribosomal protein S18 acetylase RimI-like enzyme
MPELAVLDELMANAWPPEVVLWSNGWRLRWASGVTRRANSALVAGGGEHFDDCILAAEAFYRSRGATPTFHVTAASAPPELVRFLLSRGYEPSARTFVEHAFVERVIARTGAGAWSVDATPRANDAWFDAYWEVESLRGRDHGDAVVCRQVLLRPSLPAVHVAVSEGSEVRAVGQIVIERGWAGVQCMATGVAHRRRGAASAVLHHLAREAAMRGTDRMYLAVMADNTAARRLYDAAGFMLSHEYSYFSSP